MSYCAVCSAPLFPKYSGLQGYVAASKYDIYECSNCELSCAHPLEEKDEIYRWIYDSGNRVKGYERYWRLAEVVQRSADPLREICRSDAVYEFVFRTLRADPRKELKIAEVGSGLGYLTYCLRQAGYDAVGFDISSSSVLRARSMFGPHFRVGRLEENSTPGEYDFIVCIEVLEHVSDPASLLTNMKSMMSDDSKLLLSTPDKSAFPKGSAWETELPPVHLWWFTRRSLQLLAERTGLTVDLVDTSRFLRPQFVRAKDPIPRPDRGAAFGPDGALLEAASIGSGVTGYARQFLQDSSILEPVRRIRRHVQRRSGLRPYSICAVLGLNRTE